MFFTRGEEVGMCTHERLADRGKEIILRLLLAGDHTVQKIKECLHDDALMSQDHARVQSIFFDLVHKLKEKGLITKQVTNNLIKVIVFS